MVVMHELPALEIVVDDMSLVGDDVVMCHEHATHVHIGCCTT